jgi:hypothetical protein
MKNILILISMAALAACASSGPVSQTDELTASATPARAEAEPRTSALQPGDPGYWDEEVCRREPITGTRLSRARCHTRYDWARMSGAATETMRDLGSQPIPWVEGNDP